MHVCTTATKDTRSCKVWMNSCLLKHPRTCTQCMLSSHVRSEGKIWPQKTKDLAWPERTVPCWNSHCLTCRCMLSRHVRSEAMNCDLPTSNRVLIPALWPFTADTSGWSVVYNTVDHCYTIHINNSKVVYQRLTKPAFLWWTARPVTYNTTSRIPPTSSLHIYI